MRGRHRCGFYPRSEGDWWSAPIWVRGDDGDFVVGGAEIRVRGTTGIVRAAPDMILHYVEAHGYRPPDDFIEAVTASTEGG